MGGGGLPSWTWQGGGGVQIPYQIHFYDLQKKLQKQRQSEIATYTSNIYPPPPPPPPPPYQFWVDPFSDCSLASYLYYSKHCLSYIESMTPVMVRNLTIIFLY
jgi:hypothetical protein